MLAALAIPGVAVVWMMASPAAADEPAATSAADAATIDGATEARSEADGAAASAAPSASIDASAAEASSASSASPPPATTASVAATAVDGGDGGEKPLAWDEKLSFGIRAEYAFPVGTATQAQTPLSDVVSGVFLIGGEIGYLVAPRWSVMAYFFYGFPSINGGPNSTCTAGDPTLQCSAELLRFGFVANYHFSSKKTFDPWLGLGLGYEILNETASDQTGAAVQSFSLNGLDLSSAVGVEYRPGGNFGLGPYLQGSVGHYFSDVQPPAFHGWLTIGLRLRMGP